jgi:hypothetical protein
VSTIDLAAVFRAVGNLFERISWLDISGRAGTQAAV